MDPIDLNLFHIDELKSLLARVKESPSIPVLQLSEELKIKDHAAFVLIRFPKEAIALLTKLEKQLKKEKLDKTAEAAGLDALR